MEPSSYAEFLAAKAAAAPFAGVEVDQADVHPVLKPHQRQLVEWAVRGGRRAIFAAFGTGKTVIQLETVRLTVKRSGGRALIVCPLGVHQEFEHDAVMLGVELHRIRTTDEARALPAGAIAITNYEPVRDGYPMDPPGVVRATVRLDDGRAFRLVHPEFVRRAA